MSQACDAIFSISKTVNKVNVEVSALKMKRKKVFINKEPKKMKKYIMEINDKEDVVKTLHVALKMDTTNLKLLSSKNAPELVNDNESDSDGSMNDESDSKMGRIVVKIMIKNIFYCDRKIFHSKPYCETHIYKYCILLCW